MAELEAVIFDQDGVIADTERDGHRVAFNRAFEEFGLDFQWDAGTYGQLLKVGGGKERLRSYLIQTGQDKAIEDLDAFVKSIHRRKTEIFMEIIASGQIPLRSGIARIVNECHEANIKLAVCSTANEKAVHTLIKTLLGEQVYGWFEIILAGDVVTKKKPDPEIYMLATERLAVDPANCVVIEDSRNGLLAAKGAGMKCLVTVNGYTRNEDFTEADLVVDSLGEEGKEKPHVLAGSKELPVNDQVNLDVLKAIVGAND